MHYGSSCSFSDEEQAAAALSLPACVTRQLGRRLQIEYGDVAKAPAPRTFTVLLDLISQKLEGRED